MDEVKALGAKIAEQAKTLPEILAKFPEMGLDIKETKEFTRKEYLFQQGVYLQTVEIYDALGSKEPGAFAGPLRGFRGEQYFIELLKKTAPTEDDWANVWPKEESELKKAALEAKKSELIMDYLEDLHQRSKSQISINTEAVGKVLSPRKKPKTMHQWKPRRPPHPQRPDSPRCPGRSKTHRSRPAGIGIEISSLPVAPWRNSGCRSCFWGKGDG